MIDWKLTVPMRIHDVQVVGETYVVYGDGPPPTVEILTPPPPPPPVVEPPPAPPVDTRPYEWPAGGPLYQVRDFDRTMWSWPIPGTEDALYVMLPDAGNPLIARYKNAGLITAGTFAGSRLWAPPDAPPAMLRAIITTGKP